MTILLLWASKNGHTKALADQIAEVLNREGFSVEVENALDQGARDFSGYTALVMGSPTYGRGDLHPDWDGTERAFRDRSFNGLAGAVFGCGSSRYPTAFGAVDILENRWKNNGGKLLLPALKSDALGGFPPEEGQAWAHSLAQALSKRPLG